MTPLQQLIARVIQREGGVGDAHDGKGLTRWGQTPGWLAQFNLPVPQNAQDATTNYEKWIDLTGLAPLVTSGDQLADILLDMAVMSGHRQAIKTLQTALQVTVDGTIGPQTLAALSVNRLHLAALVIAGDMEFQGAVITNNPARAIDAKGWARRMAAHVRNLV